MAEIKKHKTKHKTAKEFFSDPRYMGHATVWDSVKSDLTELFDSDRNYNRALLFLPPGSGKTFEGALALSYCLYLLANLTEPLAQFSLDAQASEIGVLNMAMSGRTAHRVLYRMLRGLLSSSKWFKHFCPVDKKITSEIRLADPFFAWSGNSSEAFPAGYTAFAGVVDEASMFLNQSHRGAYTDQVQNIYEVMEERTESRFLDEGFVILLAATSYSNPFLDDLIKESKTSGSRILVKRRPAWLSQPRSRFSGKYSIFDTETMTIGDETHKGLFAPENQKEILDQLEAGLGALPLRPLTNRENIRTTETRTNTLHRVAAV